MEPGYHHSITMSDYLADPCPRPSLSTSTAEALLYRTAKRAWFEHPRLGGHTSPPTSRGEIGSAAHALVFGGAPIEYVTEAKNAKGESFVPTDWRAVNAKAQRAAIRAMGAIPLLAHQKTQVEGVASAARTAIASLNDGPGKPEVTMLFEHEGAWCRARADWLTDRYDVDLKTVDIADPLDYERRMPRNVVIQRGLRSIGHKTLGHYREHVLLLVELEDPWEWSFVGFAPSKLAQAERIVTMAARKFTKCLADNSWPSYRTDVHWAEANQWEELENSERNYLQTRS